MTETVILFLDVDGPLSPLTSRPPNHQPRIESSQEER